MEALPLPRTAPGKTGLSAILRDPAWAIIALDFDGTLAPIVADPAQARAHPGVPRVLRHLAARMRAVIVITGRPAGTAVAYGSLDQVPGIVVLGHYGLERWESGSLTAPPPAPGLARVRSELPGIVDGVPGVWIEDKGHAISVHTRRSPDPEGALATLSPPIATLAARAGLVVEPGRLVMELRPAGVDKGGALRGFVRERGARSVLFAGDDLADLAAFAAVDAFRESGMPGLKMCSGSAEVTLLAQQADLVVDGPGGVVAFLEALLARLDESR